MQQASILMTFFVFLMGGVWLGLETGMIDKAPFQLGDPAAADTPVVIASAS